MSLQTGSPGSGCNVCPNVQSGTITRARSFCKEEVSCCREEGIVSYFRANYPFLAIEGNNVLSGSRYYIIYDPLVN